MVIVERNGEGGESVRERQCERSMSREETRMRMRNEK